MPLKLKLITKHFSRCYLAGLCHAGIDNTHHAWTYIHTHTHTPKCTKHCTKKNHFSFYFTLISRRRLTLTKSPLYSLHSFEDRRSLAQHPQWAWGPGVWTVDGHHPPPSPGIRDTVTCVHVCACTCECAYMYILIYGVYETEWVTLREHESKSRAVSGNKTP